MDVLRARIQQAIDNDPFVDGFSIVSSSKGQSIACSWLRVLTCARTVRVKPTSEVFDEARQALIKAGRVGQELEPAL